MAGEPDEFIVDLERGEPVYAAPDAPGPAIVFFSVDLVDSYRRDPAFDVEPGPRGSVWIRAVDDPEYELVLQLQPGTATERGDDGVVWCWLSQLDNVPRSELPRLHRHNVPPPRPRSWAA